MRRTESQERDLCTVGMSDFRLRHVLPGRIVLSVEAIHVVLVIVRTLAVHGLLVVPASTSEVRSRRVIRSRERAVRNTVSIHVGVTLEAPKFLEILNRKHLASIEFLRWIFERIRHPVVHAKVEIAHHEDRRLKSFGKIEGFITHIEAFPDAGRQENDVFRIAVRAINQRENVGLLRSGRQSRAR